MKAAVVAAALLLALAIAGCVGAPNDQSLGTTTENMRSDVLAGSPSAEAGDTVYVNYVGKLENGTVFDTSIQSEAQKAGLPPRGSYAPLSFVVGSGQMIKGFDNAAVGMRQGDTKTATLQPQDAYGEWDPSEVISFPRSQINATDLKVGSALYSANGAIGTVTAISGQNVTVDFNHPLAGKTLVFTISMMKVDKKATS